MFHDRTRHIKVYTKCCSEGNLYFISEQFANLIKLYHQQATKFSNMHSKLGMIMKGWLN